MKRYRPIPKFDLGGYLGFFQGLSEMSDKFQTELSEEEIIDPKTGLKKRSYGTEAERRIAAYVKPQHQYIFDDIKRKDYLSALQSTIPIWGQERALAQGKSDITDEDRLPGNIEKQKAYEESLLDEEPMYKHGGDPLYSKYHNLSQSEYNKKINVERDELEVRAGKVIKDFHGKPSHPKDENMIDIFGNTIAQVGNVIVPKTQRKEYLQGDNLTRKTIEAQLRRDQIKREKEELGMYRKGGKVSEDSIKPMPVFPGTIPGEEYMKVPLEAKADKYFGITVNVKGKDIPIYEYQKKNKLSDKELLKEVPGLKDSMKKSENFLIEHNMMRHGGGIKPDKAREILSHGEVRGKELTDKQRRFFGAHLKAQDGKYITLDDWNIPEKMPVLPGTIPTEYYPASKKVPIEYYTASEKKLAPLKDEEKEKGNYIQYLPALYNIGMGLFGDTPTEPAIYNPEKEKVKRLLAERDINYDPLFRDIELEEATAERGIRGTSRGNAGLYTNARIALANASQRAKSSARLQADIANAAFRADEARGLDILGQQDVGAENLARRTTLGFEANRAQYLPKGLEQISGISQGRNRDKILRDVLKKAKEEGYTDEEREKLRKLLEKT